MKQSIGDRRAFLRVSAMATAAAGLAACGVTPVPAATDEGVSDNSSDRREIMEKRALGRTGDMLSVVGFGGIVVKDESPESAAQLVSRAIERGINYFDVAPSYGNAEEKLGPALEPYRDSVFLACKTGERDAEGAARELKRSFELLRTDHFDLYQLHGVTRLEEVDRIFAPGGAMETFLDARERGVIRNIGFSAHSDEAALALMDRFDFDSILFPINWVCWHQGGFGPSTVQRATEKGMGILALKALARRPWSEGETRSWPKCWYAPSESREEAANGLRFTLSRGTTAAVSPSHAELLWWMCDAADKGITPLSAAEEQALQEKSAGIKPIFPH